MKIKGNAGKLCNQTKNKLRKSERKKKKIFPFGPLTVKTFTIQIPHLFIAFYFAVQV